MKIFYKHCPICNRVYKTINNRKQCCNEKCDNIKENEFVKIKKNNLKPL